MYVISLWPWRSIVNKYRFANHDVSFNYRNFKSFPRVHVRYLISRWVSCNSFPRACRSILEPWGVSAILAQSYLNLYYLIGRLLCSTVVLFARLYSLRRSSQHGRIIHEAGEAEASGPGPRKGPGPPGTTKIYKVGPVWAPKLFSCHVNVCLVMSLFAPNCNYFLWHVTLVCTNYRKWL